MQNYRRLLPLVGGVLGLLLGQLAMAQKENLEQIQQKIQQQQSKISEQKKQRQDLQQNLKAQEIEMGRVLDDLQQSQLDLKEIQAHIKRIEQDIALLLKQEKQQKKLLAEQLDAAYRAGLNPSLVERLLSEEAKDADRISAYFEHYNQVRTELIGELRQTQAALNARRNELSARLNSQQTHLNEQKTQEKTLKKVQSEREKTLRALDKTLQKEEKQLEALKAREAALSQQVAKGQQAVRQREQQEIEKLNARKMKEENRKATEQEKQQVRNQLSAGNGLKRGLPMPVSGKIVDKSKGIVIAAPAGTPIQSIAPGVVGVVNYIENLGHIVWIDHGKGYSSMYAHNQSVSVTVGQKVTAGQVIARVGNSGGQSRYALFFNIFHNGVAVDPLKFVK